MDLRVRVLSPSIVVDSKTDDDDSSWPTLTVNRDVTFADLSAILRAQGLGGPLVYFRQEDKQQHVGAEDSTQRVASLVPENELLLVQEVLVTTVDDDEGTGNISQRKPSASSSPTMKSSNPKGGGKLWPGWFGTPSSTPQSNSPGNKGSPRAVVARLDEETVAMTQASTIIDDDRDVSTILLRALQDFV